MPARAAAAIVEHALNHAAHQAKLQHDLSRDKATAQKHQHNFYQNIMNHNSHLDSPALPMQEPTIKDAVNNLGCTSEEKLMDKYRHKETGEEIDAILISRDLASQINEFSSAWIHWAIVKFAIRKNLVYDDRLNAGANELYYDEWFLCCSHSNKEPFLEKAENINKYWIKVNEAIAKDDPAIQEVAEVKKYQTVGFPNLIREAVCINESFFRRLNTGYYPEWVENFSYKAKMMFNSQNGTFIANGKCYGLGEKTLMRLKNNEEHADIVGDGFYQIHKEIKKDKPYCADQVEKIINSELATRGLGGKIFQDELGQFSFPKSIKANEIASKIADTMNQRAQDRGEKEERSMARTVAMFNALKGQNLMSEHDGWRFMEILKMVRSEVGSKFVLDDYIDGGAYCFLAGECRSQQSTTEQQ